ncbi:MAG: Cyclic di-AMP synthase CdaA [Chlamydiae bacterium]|nr:Cyclic di-AMP synthase CdaA [Chlamydiota bacterium]
MESMSFDVFTPFIEIAIMTIIFNYLLSFFWNTRSMDLVIGFLALLILYGASYLFELPVLYQILHVIVSVAVFAVLIIFQPELRIALSKINLKGRRRREMGGFDSFLENLTSSIYRMSEKRIGCIVIIQNIDSLDEFARGGVQLNAAFSSELLESIFMTSTPMHDGAVIINSNTIVSAACILPLSQNTQQLKKIMGTRHRAGLGISEITDAQVIIVSEETGRVATAREGVLAPDVKQDRFKGILRSVFDPQKPAHKSKTFREWIRQ